LKRLKREVFIKKKTPNGLNPKIWIGVLEIWDTSDFYAVVKCPVCKVGILNLNDTPAPHPAYVIDRNVKCDNCGITETFTMPTPDYALNNPKILETLRRLSTKEIQDGVANLKDIGLKLVYEAILKERGIK
jgi:hypothetical protein